MALLSNLVAGTSALLVLASVWPAAAWGWESSQQDLRIAALLRKDPDVPLAVSPMVQCRGRTVEVAVYQDPRADFRDLKIDAVLLSRTLEASLPGQFDQAVFNFYLPRDQAHFSQVTVNFGDLKRYGDGQLSRYLLLKQTVLSLHTVDGIKAAYSSLSYDKIIDPAQVVSGIYMSERKEMLKLILSLKANGYDVVAAERQFLKMEDTVRNRDKVGFELAYHQTERTIAAINRASKVRLASEDSWQR